MTDYVGTGFSHSIPFSEYENKTDDEILSKYKDTKCKAEKTGMCTNVIDGDTIEVEGVGRIRLVGVNTPESGVLGYETSKNFVKKLCYNKEVSLDIDSQKEKDKYERTLAVVIIKNKNLNEILLKEGLAEIMYIPPSEFSPHLWTDDNNIVQEIMSTAKTDVIELPSTIINQKKQIFLYVSQSKNLVWPNGTYNYQVYVKNISGQNIENLKIYVANPKEVVIKEKSINQTYEIPTLKNGQSVLININDVTIMKEGYYYVNFIATADESEIQTKTLMIKCGFENDNKKTLHRIAFYNFSPYENSYMQRASDFSQNVTQLTKIQTKPFEAYNQPFEMDNFELDLYAQDIFLTNTDDMPSMYLGRENWESNLEESFTGETLSDLISRINEESNLVDIDFLRVGCNEMTNDFQQIYPKGFIHRFGLMKSEFYKALGIIPKIYSINDDLFRWARDENEPIIYPLRENDKWGQKPWCGTGYYVYEHIVDENNQIYNIEKAIFTTKEDALQYIENLEEFNHNHFIDNISYTYLRRDWLPGVFYVEIPFKDIPANFYLPDVEYIQSIIELTKPFGLKGYPRFGLNESFNHQMQFSNTPTFKPHITFDLGEYNPINYHIRQRKYQNTSNGVKLLEYGKQYSYVNNEIGIPSIFSYYPKFTVAKKYDSLPNNSMSVDIEQEVSISYGNGDKSFDGKRNINNSLDELILKNPEDISFYSDNIMLQFNPLFKNVNNKTSLYRLNDCSDDNSKISIPVQYKTLDYHNKTTSKAFEIKESATAIQINKEITPYHISTNFVFQNADKTKDFIISYKRLYDDVYKISYKTYKNKETVIKEVVTQFNHILCEISHISITNTSTNNSTNTTSAKNKDLIKIYYSLNGKTYFLTAFTTDLFYNKEETTEKYYSMIVSLTNDLVLSSKFTFNPRTVQLGEMKYKVNELMYPDWYLSNKQYSSIISTDHYVASETIRSTLNWHDLYKINEDETSFTLFENTTLEETPINDVQLYIDNLKIPNNSIVDKIYVTLYTSTKEQVTVTPSYQVNANLTNNVDNIGAVFDIDGYNIYNDYNLKYLYNKLAYYEEKENEEQIEYYKQLIDDNNRHNKDINIDFDKTNPLIIKNNYWNEVSFEESTKTLKTSDIKSVYLILEGYNHGDDVTVNSQLVYYDGASDVQKTVINAGYFYKRIPIIYNARYNIASLNIRYRFNDVSKISLYGVKTHILFNNPQKIDNQFIDGEELSMNQINKYFCNICENIDGDKVQNGLIVNLRFSDIHNYLKIYSAVINVIYHEKAFTNIFETASDFNKLNCDNILSDIVMRGAVYDEDVSDMRQDSYTLRTHDGEYDAGFEMNNRIYQAFTAQEDNITSIELKLNGKTGAPDNYLKIAIWDNYENVPHTILKEVIVNVAKDQPIDGEANKYNICVNDLIIGDTYWFSIEPVDKTKTGMRRFLYNNYQIDDFKLLSEINGDMINQHASLYFRLYSKRNTYSFKNIPYIFTPECDSSKKINFITEIQIYDGNIKNFTESMFSEKTS